MPRCLTAMPPFRFPTAWRARSTRALDASAGLPLYLVGGAIRDLLRGEAGITDVDLAVDGDAGAGRAAPCPAPRASRSGDRPHRLRHVDRAVGGHARRPRAHPLGELRPSRLAARGRAGRHRGRPASPRLHGERDGASARERRQPARSGRRTRRPRAPRDPRAAPGVVPRRPDPDLPGRALRRPARLRARSRDRRARRARPSQEGLVGQLSGSRAARGGRRRCCASRWRPTRSRGSARWAPAGRSGRGSTAARMPRRCSTGSSRSGSATHRGRRRGAWRWSSWPAASPTPTCRCSRTGWCCAGARRRDAARGRVDPLPGRATRARPPSPRLYRGAPGRGCARSLRPRGAPWRRRLPRPPARRAARDRRQRAPRRARPRGVAAGGARCSRELLRRKRNGELADRAAELAAARELVARAGR